MSPWTSFEDRVDFKFPQEAGDDKVCSAQHLRDVFSICSVHAVPRLLSPGNKGLSGWKGPLVCNFRKTLPLCLTKISLKIRNKIFQSSLKFLGSAVRAGRKPKGIFQ